MVDLNKENIPGTSKFMNIEKNGKFGKKSDFVIATFVKNLISKNLSLL